MEELLDLSVQGEVQFVCLNRPHKRNALNNDLILALERVFDRLPSQVKCVIIHGAGKHFSAGLDLASLCEQNIEEAVHHSRMWHRVMDKVQFAKVPVIAVLHGACVGGGLELASSCHIRVAENSTFYALPEGQRGIFVGGGGAVRIPKLIGMARMTDMMLTGRVYTAAEGYPVGFSQYLEADGNGLTKAVELAKKISQNAPMTNYALIHILPRITDANQDIGLMMESLTAAIAQDAPEAKRRLQDFLAGRAKKVGQ
jgi:(methylthio)acryloyl-CoA hydratase